MSKKIFVEATILVFLFLSVAYSKSMMDAFSDSGGIGGGRSSTIGLRTSIEYFPEQDVSGSDDTYILTNSNLSLSLKPLKSDSFSTSFTVVS